jgi:hypothetical protein
MKTLADYPLDELKLIYRTLHAQLPTAPDLMDAGLLLDLQTWLQGQARAAGVDVSHHAQWAAWLSGRPFLREV